MRFSHSHMHPCSMWVTAKEVKPLVEGKGKQKRVSIIRQSSGAAEVKQIVTTKEVWIVSLLKFSLCNLIDSLLKIKLGNQKLISKLLTNQNILNILY